MAARTKIVLKEYQHRKSKGISPISSFLELPYGSGKSIIALDYAAQRHTFSNEGLIATILCMPRNILTWQVQIKRECPDWEIIIGEKGLRDLLDYRGEGDSPYPAVLLFPHHRIAPCFEQLRRLITQFDPPGTWIFDESTKIKNPKTQITQAAHALRLAAEGSPRFLALTGRACPEGWHEIWGQFQWCYGSANPLGETYYKFLNRWFIKHDYGYALDLMKQDAFFTLLDKHRVTFTTKDKEDFFVAKGIKDRRYVMEMYEETPEQRKILDHLYTHWELPLDDAVDDEPFSGKAEEYSHAMALAAKAQQIASGFYYTGGKRTSITGQHDAEGVGHIKTSEREVNFLKWNPKLDALISVLRQLIEENPSRGIVVWHRYTAERDFISATLNMSGIRCVIGPDPEALIQFACQDGVVESSPSVILMPCGVSQGFNELVRADTDIYFSNLYSAELRDQAEARIDRLGQKHTTITHIDMCSTRLADMEIVTALQSKTLTPERLNTIVRKHAARRVSS
jgi:hypothetical protein